MYTKNMSKKYLDSKGLSYLWQKITDKYLQKQSLPNVENELIYFDDEKGFISNQLLSQDDVLFVNTQEDYDLCSKTERIETDILSSWKQFQCNTNNSNDNINAGKYNTTIFPEYGKGVLGNTTGESHPASGYGWWYNDGTNIKNDINSRDFNGYIMPFNKNRYSFDTLFGCYSNESTSGDQIGFSIVNDKNALPRRVETTDGTYYRNTLYDKLSIDNNNFKHPSQSAWVKEDKINNTAKVIFTAGPTVEGDEESFPTVDSNFTVYDIENIRTSAGRKKPVRSNTTVKITSTHEATGYLGLLTVVVTNSTGIDLAQGDGTKSVSGDTGTIYVFGSVFDIKTKKWNSTKIIDGSVNADGNYWKLGKNLVEYNAAYNGNDANKTCIIRCNASYNDGKLEISFGDPVSYSNRDNADFNGSKLSFDFKNKTYSFESYHENGSPIHEIKHDIHLSSFTPTVHINETSKRLSNDEFWSLFTGDTKFMYNAYSYGYLYIKVLNMITDGKVIFIHEDNTNTEYELNEKRTEYISKGNIQTKDILTGSRLVYNPITKKLFYSNGEKIYQIAGGISDKDIIDSPIGGITNEQVKYLFDSVLNSYSFGYQREITENIKVRRLEDSEKRNLSETYGVDWNYINIDNKIQEGAKGKLYSDEVNYIDEISDIKYVDLLNGGTLFNCNSVIIPEDDYNVHEFTYKYSSGVEGTNAFAEGDATLASGNSSHAEGEWNTAYGDYSHAEGESTTSQGQASHSEGEDTLAIGDASHAEGSRTLGVGDYSHTEGYGTIGIGSASHAEGYNTTAKGRGAHSEGSETIAKAYASHAEGEHTTAQGYASHAEGSGFMDIETYTQKTAIKIFSDADYLANVYENTGINFNYFTDAADAVSILTGAELYNPNDTDLENAIGEIAISKYIGGYSDTIPERICLEIAFYDGYTADAFPDQDGGKLVVVSLRSGSYGAYSHSEGYITIARGVASHAEGAGSLACNDASHAEGMKSNAYGIASHAEGSSTVATGNSAHAEGFSTVASGSFSHAEGSNTEATGRDSHAEGAYNKSIGIASHAEGDHSIANGEASHTEGYKSVTGGTATTNDLTAGTDTTSGAYAHAEGNATIAKGISSHAEGQKTFASGKGSHAEGAGTTASGDCSHAEGADTTASGIASHAEGMKSNAYGIASHAEGSSTVATGNSAHAEGFSTVASGSFSHAEGSNTEATGRDSHAEGAYNKSIGIASHAEGDHSIANGEASHTEGYKSVTGGTATTNDLTAGTDTTSGAYAHAEGNATIAKGISSHAEGQKTFASGKGSHAEGAGTTASGDCSHAEGADTTASGIASHAEGMKSNAYGIASHAEGYYDLSFGNFSHVEGYMTTAKGDASHAEGADTTASGIASHAEGDGTTASGNKSHSEGTNTTASGMHSHAEGYSTITNNKAEHAEGKFNKSNTTTISSIGIGTSNTNRKNAFEVMQNGDTYLINAGGYDGTNSENENSVGVKAKSLQEIIDSSTQLKVKLDLKRFYVGEYENEQELYIGFPSGTDVTNFELEVVRWGSVKYRVHIGDTRETVLKYTGEHKIKNISRTPTYISDWTHDKDLFQVKIGEYGYDRDGYSYYRVLGKVISQNTSGYSTEYVGMLEYINTPNSEDNTKFLPIGYKNFDGSFKIPAQFFNKKNNGICVMFNNKTISKMVKFGTILNRQNGQWRIKI